MPGSPGKQTQPLLGTGTGTRNLSYTNLSAAEALYQPPNTDQRPRTNTADPKLSSGGTQALPPAATATVAPPNFAPAVVIVADDAKQQHLDDEKLESRQQYCRTFGKYVTKTAMAIQGVLGGLFMYVLISNGGVVTIVFASITGGIVGYASYAGKDRLVNYYNNAAFESSASVTAKDFHPEFLKNPSFLGKITDAVTSASKWYCVANGAKTFAGLCYIGLDQLSKTVLIKDFKWYTIGAIASHWATATPFALASTIANFFAFKFLIPAGFNLFLRGAQYLFINPEYRLSCKKISHIIEDLRVKLRDLAEEGKWQEYNDALLTVLPINASGSSPIPIEAWAKNQSHLDDDIRAIIIANYVATKDFEPLSWPYFMLQQATALLASGISVYGLNNFIQMTRQTNEFFKLVFLNSFDPYINFSICMNFLAVVSVYGYISNAFDTERAITFVSQKQRYIDTAFSAGISLAGSTPNAMQAVIAGQQWYDISAAAASSAINEFDGFRQLTSKNRNDEICAKDPNKATARKNDEILRRLADFSQIKTQALYNLIDTHANKAPNANKGVTTIDINHQRTHNSSAATSAGVLTDQKATAAGAPSADPSATAAVNANHPPRWRQMSRYSFLSTAAARNDDGIVDDTVAVVARAGDSQLSEKGADGKFPSASDALLQSTASRCCAW